MVFRSGLKQTRPYLVIEGNTVSQYDILENGVKRVIICDIVDKTTRILEMQVNESEYHEIEYEMLEEDIEVDISFCNETWTGSILHYVPFGYGKITNSDRLKVYEGFFVGGKKVCYGTTYYCEYGQKEYEGTYCDGLKHGYGRVYSYLGRVLYEGFWLNNASEYTTDVVIPSRCKDYLLVHSLIERLVIGEHSYRSRNLKELVIDYPKLKECVIHAECFIHVQKLVVSCLYELERFEIGAFCFFDEKDGNSTGECSIVNCPKLSQLCIHNHSFVNYNALVLESEWWEWCEH